MGEKGHAGGRNWTYGVGGNSGIEGAEREWPGGGGGTGRRTATVSLMDFVRVVAGGFTRRQQK